MIERKNRPTKESWWFSGGRILFGELRKDATTRKLKEECVLSLISVSEFGTLMFYWIYLRTGFHVGLQLCIKYQWTMKLFP
jgi:hypothetical protein